MAKISMFVLDVTAVVATALGLLTALSGLCLVKPDVVERGTLGLLDSYAVCSRLHLGWSALATIIVTVVHAAAGFDLWLVRLRLSGGWAWLVAGVFSLWLIYLYLA